MDANLIWKDYSPWCDLCGKRMTEDVIPQLDNTAEIVYVCGTHPERIYRTGTYFACKREELE
jgi:hypothetical protein